MIDNDRPVVQHMHGPGVPARGALAPFEIGIGYETITVPITKEDGTITSEEKTKFTLYTSFDGENIIPITNGENAII